MGDMREAFDALKAYHKERRGKNYKAAKDNLKRLGELVDGVTINTEWHWSFTLEGDRVDYWPSSSKWRWRSQTRHGSISSLIGFIKNRQKYHKEMLS